MKLFTMIITIGLIAFGYLFGYFTGHWQGRDEVQTAIIDDMHGQTETAMQTVSRLR